MDVVPLVVLTVRCVVTRHYKQMVASLLERMPTQRPWPEEAAPE